MKIRINVSDGKDIFFISDFHLFHKNVIKFDNRPFLDKTGEPDVQAMHRTIIANWNDVVGKDDVVFYLGDLVFGRPERANEVLWALNGKIHFVMGNHDEYDEIVNFKRFETVNDYVDLNIIGDTKYPNLHFAVMHYPIYSHNRANHGSIHVHAHTHGSLTKGAFYKNRRAIDVGCNMWDYTPVSYKEIVEDLKNINVETTSKRH